MVRIIPGLVVVAALTAAPAALAGENFDLWVWSDDSEVESLFAVSQGAPLNDHAVAVRIDESNDNEQYLPGVDGATAVAHLQKLIDDGDVDVVLVDKGPGTQKGVTIDIGEDEASLHIRTDDEDSDASQVLIRGTDSDLGSIVLIRGADADEARDFIDDLDDVSQATRQRMRQDMGL